MSAQSTVYNPSQTTSAATGDGFSCPRLTTAGRLAINFTTADKGMMVFDTDLLNLFIWDGTAWESIPASGDSSDTQVIFNDNGVLVGDAGLTYQKTVQRLTVGTTLDIWRGLLQDSLSTAVGNLSLSATQAGAIANTAIGYRAQYRATTGSQNTSVGYNTLSALGMSGSNNTVIGFNSGNAITSGSGHVIVGSYSGNSGGLDIRTASNYVVLADGNGTLKYSADGSGVQNWYVGGSTAMTLNSTGLGVGVASPAFKLQVVGTSGSLVDFCGSAVAGLQTLVRIRTASANTNGLLIQGNVSNDEMYINNYYNAALSFGTGNTERLRIDSSGNVGVGVTPSAWGSFFKSIESGAPSAYVIAASNVNGVQLASNCYNDNTNWLYKTTGTAARFAVNTSQFQWFTSPSGTAGTAITFTQAMTLDASGNLLVGTTGAAGKITALAGASGQAAVFQQPAQNFWCVLAHNQATSGDNSFVLFGTEASFTSRGSITYNRAGGLVAYNTTSDYRSKDIIGPVSNSGSLIDSLKVYVGKMKGATIERPMLIAHEVQEIAPYAVTGTKDEVDADGKPKYQQMDASALVPLLIAEIQSLRTRVQTLETR